MLLLLDLTLGDPVAVVVVGLLRAGLRGGDGVAAITGMCTHFWQSTSLPVKVTRSPDGNGCLHRAQVKHVL